MVQNLLVGEASGGRVFSLGGQGVILDVALARGSGPDASWESKPYSPAGEGGIVVFRRIIVAIKHSAGFAITVTPYVDGTELMRADGTTSQARTKTVTRGPGGLEMEYVEFPIMGRGTSLEFTLTTGAVSGDFYIEGLIIGHEPVRGLLLDNR